MNAPRLIGLPYDAASSYLRGAAEAPPAIRAALNSPAGNSYTELLVDILGPGGLTDGGDLALPDIPNVVEPIVAGMAPLLAAGFRPIVLGGDHSVTYPVLRAVNASKAPLTIVHLDAHPDLYDSFEGNRLSHACPLARVMEEGLATRLVQAGIRTMNAHNRQQADRFGVEVIDMRAWSKGIRPKVDGPFYLTIDLDAIDPAYAPGVSHQEPGGLSVRDVVGVIQDCGGTLIGADVVEYNPRLDLGQMTAIVAAKLVKEIAGRMMAGAVITANQGRK